MICISRCSLRCQNYLSFFDHWVSSSPCLLPLVCAKWILLCRTPLCYNYPSTHTPVYSCCPVLLSRSCLQYLLRSSALLATGRMGCLCSTSLFWWYFIHKQVQLAWEVVAFSPSRGWDSFRELGVPQHAEDGMHFCRQRRFGMYKLFKFKNVYSNREPLGGRLIIKNGAESYRHSVTIVHLGSCALGGYLICLSKVY